METLCWVAAAFMALKLPVCGFDKVPSNAKKMFAVMIFLIADKKLLFVVRMYSTLGG